MPQQFVHLHVHTQYSLLDGATRINKIFARCEQLNMPAVAITDHGNMYGALEFVKAAIAHTDPKANPFEFIAEGREPKVKPIIGCEVYMTDNMDVKTSVDGHMPKNNHLILLCKNETGYKNLIKIVSDSFTKGMYYKPRTDFEHIREHSEGLICLSACIAGVIPQCLLAGDMAGANEWARKFKSVFGEDFYIEIQDHNIREQKIVLPLLRDVAVANGIKMVATNDIHYLEKKDALSQKVLQNIAFRRTMSPEDNYDDDVLATGGSDDDYFPTREFYMKDGDSMAELFRGYEGAIVNTLEVAEKCDFRFFRKEPLLPGYVPDDGSKPNEFLRKLCYDGLQYKYGNITDDIRERAEYELGVIEKMGFVDYFLIVWDFIHYAETHGVPVGPGRGSGVGSIVAYAIGITKCDPIKYALIFERFLNVERVSNPDFDIDFCVDGRDRVISYVIEKYGIENVSQIVTFGTLAAKQAVKDVGRVFNVPIPEVNKIANLIPKMMGKNHIGHLLGLVAPKKADDPDPKIPELIELYNNDPMSRKILDMAMEIEGMPRQTGMHAAGVIICKDRISDHVPMAKNSDGIVTTQFNMIECEELGLLKMDFLGLRTLTDIAKAVRYVKEEKGIDIDFYKMEYDDPQVFQLISEGDTHAVFQLEGEGIRKFMRDLKPSSLEDVVAGISLYRPGPMDKIGDYVHNKRHPEDIVYDDPKCESILKVTYGIMVYQEQVMEIVRKLGGYSFGRADIVRRMMSKKKKEAMEKEREIFLNGTTDHGVVIKGCVANGVAPSVANKIYDDMISFASYAFNKSHAVAYAHLAYQTAYLKRYHTVEFITAVLNNRITSIEEITNYLTYLKEHDIKVLPPNINKSIGEFKVENGGVRIGMAAIKNVGATLVNEVVAERERNGEFTDFVDFVRRMQTVAADIKSRGTGEMFVLNKKMLESLIYAGTFDCFGHTRSQLIAVYEVVFDRVNKDIAAKARGQFSFFDMAVDKTIDEFKYPNIKEYSLGDKLRLERDVAGVYLTGHPLDEYKDRLKEFKHNTAMFAISEDDEDEMQDEATRETTVELGGMLIEAEHRYNKNNQEMGIGKLEDLYGTVSLLLSQGKYRKYRGLWQKDKLVTVKGKANYRDDGVTIWVDSMSAWDASMIKPQHVKMMCIYLSFSMSESKILNDIVDILRAYPGDDEIYIRNTDDNSTSKLTLGIDACEMLRNELYGIQNISNVKIAGKNREVNA